MKQNKLTGIFLLAFVTALWGLSFPLVKNALETTKPFLFMALRFDIASIVLACFALFKRRRLSVSTCKQGLFIGIVLFFGFAFQTLGLQKTSATNSAFLTGLSVAFVPVFAIFLGTALSLKVAIGVSMATLGLWLLSGGDISALNHGDTLTLLCAVCFAVQIIFLSKVGLHHDVIVLTTAQMIVVALMSHLASLIFEHPVAMPESLTAWSSIIFAGVFLSAIPFLVQVQVQRTISAVSAAMIFSTEPIWGALAAYLINNERLPLLGYMGGAIMIIGILVVESPPLLKILRPRGRLQ